MKTSEYIILKLSEESTWRGIVLLVTALGAKLAPDMAESIITVGLALVGLINVVKKQGASKVDAVVAATAAVEKNNVEVLGLPPAEITPPKAVVIDEATMLPKPP
jgi:hypothetical protein